MGVFLAALSALLYGSADFTGGYASRQSSTFAVVVVSQLFGVAAACIGALILGSSFPSPSDLLWGAGAGVGGAVGLLALYRGIASGIVSIVSPVTAVVGAIIPFLYGIFLGERPGVLSLAGIALCLPAAALLGILPAGSMDRRRALGSLFFGLAAGAGFGIFYVCISRPSAGAGLWPIAAARSLSIAIVAIAAALSGRRPFTINRGLGFVALAGLCDMGANIAFILAARATLLSVAGVISSLYPAPTVILGALVFKERVGPLRTTGLIAAIAGTALVGLGAR